MPQLAISASGVYRMSIRTNGINKIKERIEKLLRLSLSDNCSEASLAAAKAIELMQKYSLSRTDLKKDEIVMKDITVEFARVPGWLRTLYSNIAQINGCYMVWKNGYKHGTILERRAQITLVGLEKDLINIDYYTSVLIKEIQLKAEIFKKEISSEREMVKSYRMGLVHGVYNLLYKASQTFNSSLKNNTLIAVDQRYENAKVFYQKENKVNTVQTKYQQNIGYDLGLLDSQNLNVSRPIQNDVQEYKQLMQGRLNL